MPTRYLFPLTSFPLSLALLFMLSRIRGGNHVNEANDKKSPGTWSFFLSPAYHGVPRQLGKFIELTSWLVADLFATPLSTAVYMLGQPRQEEEKK